MLEGGRDAGGPTEGRHAVGGKGMVGEIATRRNSRKIVRRDSQEQEEKEY